MTRFTDMFTELVRLEIELWNGLDAYLVSTAGITLTQFQALDAILANSGRVRVQDISERMAITVGATSKVVDRLERDGLAVRTAHPTDRRSSVVSLTDRGASAARTSGAAAEKHLRETLDSVLSDDGAGRLHCELTSLRAQARVEIAR